MYLFSGVLLGVCVLMAGVSLYMIGYHQGRIDLLKKFGALIEDFNHKELDGMTSEDLIKEKGKAEVLREVLKKVF